MNKISHITILTILISSIALFFTSCDDDNNNYKVDEGWKSKNEELFNKAKASGDYKSIYTYSSSTTPGGITDKFILSKPSNLIITESSIAPFISSDGIAEFTDSIRCRYEGWYFDENNEKYIFDSTENRVTGSTGSYPNYVPRGFKVSGIVEGWRTALQEMHEGDEREIIIPWTLGYGAYGSGSIKPHTTLYFRIKLIKIVQMKGQK